jgi:hypothetical protein
MEMAGKLHHIKVTENIHFCCSRTTSGRFTHTMPCHKYAVLKASGVPRNFFGGVQQIQLRTESRENGDLGAVAPYSGVLLSLQVCETRILIRLLRMYFPRNREFGSALSKLRNFGGFETPNPPPYATAESDLSRPGQGRGRGTA